MRMSISGVLLMLGMLFGCYPKGDPSKPIPTDFIPAPQPAHRLVIVLPGRGDGLAGLQRAGIAQAIQSQWPDADVTLSGLAIGYYLQGGAIGACTTRSSSPRAAAAIAKSGCSALRSAAWGR